MASILNGDSQYQQSMYLQTKTFVKQLFRQQKNTHLSYSEKYKKWIQFLQKLQTFSTSHQSEKQLIFALNIFLEEFPFNYQHWFKYIQLSSHQNIVETIKLYEIALKRNSKSYQLWLNYLLLIKNKFHSQKSQIQTKLAVDKQNKILKDQLQKITQKYKKQIEKGIIQVGADMRSVQFYQQYYLLINENFRYQFFKKIMTRSLIGLQEQFTKFKEWIQNQTTQSMINFLYTKQTRGVVSLLNNPSMTIDQKKQYLFRNIEQVYRKTLKHRQKLCKIYDQIKYYYFNGSHEQKQQLQKWKELIQLQRQQNVAQNISYVYQRSLIAQTQNIQLWNEAFYYLQHQANKYMKVLNILRNNKKFFIQFRQNRELYFYWCEMQERENSQKSRNMYKELLDYYEMDMKNDNNRIIQENAKNDGISNGTAEITLQNNSNLTMTYILQTYQRYIQFQIRQKQYSTVKELYDKLLVKFGQDHQILSLILIQYSKFVIKYYKDLMYPKKLLFNYFEYLPYNDYFMYGYLEFLKNFQNNDGYYDELMKILSQAVRKAKKEKFTKRSAMMRNNMLIGVDQWFNQNVIKMIKNYLRQVLGSIYLIKLSERKIIQIANQPQNTQTNIIQQEEFNEFNQYQNEL